jgi:hypothetical protein
MPLPERVNPIDGSFSQTPDPDGGVGPIHSRYLAQMHIGYRWLSKAEKLLFIAYFFEFGEAAIFDEIEMDIFSLKVKCLSRFIQFLVFYGNNSTSDFQQLCKRKERRL